MPHPWKYTWLTDWETIWSEPFLAQWATWFAQSPSRHVFAHPALAKAWVQTYLPMRDLRPLFLICTWAETTVFLPLVLWRKNWKHLWQRELLPLGGADFDYHDPLVAGPGASLPWAEFWALLPTELARLGLPWDRINIAGISGSLAVNGAGWQADEECPRLDLSHFTSPDQLLPTLGQSLRGDLKRQMRRLSEQGDVDLHVYGAGDLPQGLASLPDFLLNHSLRWPQAYKAPRFHENLLACGLPKDIVHFSELRLDHRPISWHLGFVDGCRYYYYLPAIDPKFAKFSPGKVHLLKCVEEAIRMRLSLFDHLRGREPYKADWANSSKKLYRFTVTGESLRSRMQSCMIEKIKAKGRSLPA